jgi:hypothetical protein
MRFQNFTSRFTITTLERGSISILPVVAKGEMNLEGDIVGVGIKIPEGDPS